MYIKKKTDISFDFAGKNVLVFGGSRGIGKEVCRQFIISGAEVHSISRTSDVVDGANHIKCDISNPEEITKVFSKFEKVDFVINVAGTNLCDTIENIDIDEWERLMNINLRSFYLVCKESIIKMKKHNFGRIVNVSSIAGRNRSVVSGVHYTSSKYGIIGLTKQLSNEVAKYNILVNCTCPSQTLTEMLRESMTPTQISELETTIPIRRIASVEEQAKPILFLCSDAASYISGTALDINGGQL